MNKVVLYVVMGVLVLFALNCQAQSQPALAPTPTPVVEVEVESPQTKSTLILPQYEDGRHAYYVDLVEQSLKLIDADLTVQLSPPIPQKRALQMLVQGDISMVNLVQSAERDAAYPTLDINLTNGLIGNRIFLIPPDTADAYDVADLDEFRQLGKVGGFGKGWFDVKVWEHNKLPYLEVDGEWAKIYDMLLKSDRGVDYFSRGFNEILADATAHPDLIIEPHLVLIYERDMRFYLSPTGVEHQAVLGEALHAAQDAGLMDELIRQYWATDFDVLQFEQRTKIYLDVPQ